MLISLLALAVAVAAFAVAITRRTEPSAARGQQFAYPPPLSNISLGDTPQRVRRILGPPRAIHRYRVPPDLCWDYVFPTSYPHYRLCFLHGRLTTRTPF
jgi:hypothetical protein